MLTRTVTRVGKLVRGFHLGKAEATRLVQVGYRLFLKRNADPVGLADFSGALRSGRITPSEFLIQLATSVEGSSPPPSVQYPTFGHALHAARMAMVRQLPKADVIVDLGGGAEGVPVGALVLMGYPYPFRTLTVVEPPPTERHDLYRNVAPGSPAEYDTGRGVVRYVYRSMADLAPIPSGSVDLVFSGESIEHVSRGDCERVLAEARRVLRPTGHFCFDTPNRALTRLQVGDHQFINPDHKVEYAHPEMVELLHRHGFEVAEAKGITWMPESARTGQFDISEMLCHVGVYDDIENCYLLYYRCRPR
jgi:SAM-dependent methyltransferase